MEENEHREEVSMALVFDRLCDAIFLLDVVVQFFTVPYDMVASAYETAPPKLSDAEVVTPSQPDLDHAAVARRYATTWLLYDLIASVPLDLLYTIPEQSVSKRLEQASQNLVTASNSTRIVALEYELHNPYGRYVLRFNALLRLAHIKRYLKAFARADGIGIRLRYFFRMKHVHIEVRDRESCTATRRALSVTQPHACLTEQRKQTQRRSSSMHSSSSASGTSSRASSGSS